MGRMSTANCVRCRQGGADFLHVMWYCNNVLGYWKLIVDKLSKILRRQVPNMIEVCLLGLLEDEHWYGCTKIFLQKALFIARKQIVEIWIQSTPLLVSQWVKAVNQIITYKSIMHDHRGN